MKFAGKIWFPSLVVAVAAIQAVGSSPGVRFDAVRPEATDTVIYDNSRVFSKFRKEALTVQADSLGEEDSPADSVAAVLTARDTVKAPDSLRLSDPFRYKYYVALMDSLTHRQVVDSLRQAGDSLDWPRIDSIYFADSALAAKLRFEKWYNSLDKAARKRYDYEQKMKVEMRKMDSLISIKDSIRARKDSIRQNTPRILETFALPSDWYYKKTIGWTRDPLFSKLDYFEPDTSYKAHFYDYPYQKQEIDASSLGIAGAAVQPYDFFHRGSVDGISFYKNYESWTWSPSTLTHYNTKTPYTELAYWGTLLANTEREEANIHILTTQNIYPELNLRLEYDRFGSNGMLTGEDTDNRSFAASANYMGKRWLAHAGYIYNKVERSENGGIVDNFWVRDTTVDAREIDVHLSDADTKLVKNTWFLDQTYRFPLSFVKDLLHRSDSAAAKRDESDSLDTRVTTFFLGHSSEYSTFRKIYTDNIAATDVNGRAFYKDFFLNPTTSNDSVHVRKLDNRIFAKLQPWAPDALLSSLDVGAGYRMMKWYAPGPRSYIAVPRNVDWNTLYIYGGAGGRSGRHFIWDAAASLDLLGHDAGDFSAGVNATFNMYPFRRHKDSPLSLSGRFQSTLKEPDYYEQHYWSNHYRWDNAFRKSSETRLEGSLDIPHWDFRLDAAYALLDGNLYYDNDGIIRQNGKPMSVAKLALMKNFKLGLLHLDNRVLMQVSSDNDVLPLPAAAANLKWYIQFDVKKNAMQMQLGANAVATSLWYAPAYNPAVGVFHNQHDEKYGNCPVIDIFANIQWKRACIFLKLSNAGMGWPNESADYFSAHGYIRTQRSFKFGIWWPFSAQGRKVNTMSSRAGASPGGSSGLGSALGGVMGSGSM